MSCSWPVDQMPPVGSEVFPSDILRVVPKSADLKHEKIIRHELIFIANYTMKSPVEVQKSNIPVLGCCLCARGHF